MASLNLLPNPSTSLSRSLPFSSSSSPSSSSCFYPRGFVPRRNFHAFTPKGNNHLKPFLVVKSAVDEAPVAEPLPFPFGESISSLKLNLLVKFFFFNYLLSMSIFVLYTFFLFYMYIFSEFS